MSKEPILILQMQRMGDLVRAVIDRACAFPADIGGGADAGTRRAAGDGNRARPPL